MENELITDSKSSTKIKLEKFINLLFYLSIILFFIGFNFTDSPPFGWYQQFLPNIGSHTISDVFFLDSLNGWAVTPYFGQNDTAFVLKTTNGGDNWFKSNTRVGQYTGFNKVKFLNPLTGYVCGPLESGGFTSLCKSTDGGYNWISINVPDPYVEFADMSILNADTIWLVAYDSFSGGVFRTTNGGISWTRQYSAGSDNPNKIYMFNARIGFIAENSFPQYINLRKTTDGGYNWFSVNSEGFTDMHFIDSLTGWKSTGYPDSSMKKTTDGGSTWIKENLPHGGIISNLGGILRFSNVNKDTIWGTGNYVIYPNSQVRPFLYRTTNGGTNWYYQILDTSLIHLSAPYYYITFINKSVGWAYYLNRGIHTVTGGDTTFLSGIQKLSNSIPDDYKLYQNYPNPFNPRTVIGYEIKKNSFVKIEVFDVMGREVINLVNQRQTAGKYDVDFSGKFCPSGVYFYRLTAEGFSETKKMLLLR